MSKKQTSEMLQKLYDAADMLVLEITYGNSREEAREKGESMLDLIQDLADNLNVTINTDKEWKD